MTGKNLRAVFAAGALALTAFAAANEARAQAPASGQAMDEAALKKKEEEDCLCRVAGIAAAGIAVLSVGAAVILKMRRQAHEREAQEEKNLRARNSVAASAAKPSVALEKPAGLADFDAVVADLQGTKPQRPQP